MLKPKIAKKQSKRKLFPHGTARLGRRVGSQNKECPMDKAIRLLKLLQMLPKLPMKQSASDIHEKLGAMGIQFTKRTIERDLNELSEHFPIAHDDCTPQGWSWAKEAQTDLSLFKMDTNTAVTFSLAEQHLKNLLPQTQLRQLKPFFEEAKNHLARSSKPGLKNWSKRVAVIPRGVNPMPPLVSAQVESKVAQALVDSKTIVFHYCKKDGTDDIYEVSPAGLVSRGNILYMVAFKATALREQRLFALHRMSKCELTESAAQIPLGFDLSADPLGLRLQFGGDKSEILKVKIRVTGIASHAFSDTKISSDQKTHWETSGASVVEFSYPNTEDLKWWLLGYGESVEVLEPLALRKEMSTRILKSVKKYGT
jgi:predicted DNA-binding transcriptional regulator YafY